MSERPWYKRYPSNFIAGTLGLSLEEKGAYSLVLDLIYDRGGPIPDDPRYIAGVCGCSVRKWNVIRERLIALGKITAANGTISNYRADKELENSAKSSEERAESGRKGGLKRAEKAADAKENNDLPEAELKHTRMNQREEAREEKEPPPEVPKRPRRGTRIPDDWKPDIAAAEAEGLSRWEAEREASKFRDYWLAQPGQKGVKLDWAATWRNWVRRAAETLGRTPRISPAAADATEHTKRRDHYRRTGTWLPAWGAKPTDISPHAGDQPSLLAMDAK